VGRAIKWTEEKIEQLKYEGYGQGFKESYKSWLTVQTVNSRGTSHQPFCLKTQRHLQLLSNIELALFLALDWQEDVVDIREGFPLDRDFTCTVADRLGIRHPSYPGTHVKTVMTVDFMVTRIRNGVECLEAYNAKPTSEEKLEIQRASLAELDIPHHLVFDTDIPAQHIKNLAWINGALLKKNEKERYTGHLEEMAQHMEGSLAPEMRRSTSLGKVCQRFDADLGEPAGTGIRGARILMAKHVLVPDLSCADLLAAPLLNFHLSSSTEKARAAGGSK
jgi:hypothetical protein